MRLLVLSTLILLPVLFVLGYIARTQLKKKQLSGKARPHLLDAALEDPLYDPDFVYSSMQRAFYSIFEGKISAKPDLITNYTTLTNADKMFKLNNLGPGSESAKIVSFKPAVIEVTNLNSEYEDQLLLAVSYQILQDDLNAQVQAHYTNAWTLRKNSTKTGWYIVEVRNDTTINNLKPKNISRPDQDIQTLTAQARDSIARSLTPPNMVTQNYLTDQTSSAYKDLLEGSLADARLDPDIVNNFVLEFLAQWLLNSESQVSQINIFFTNKQSSPNLYLTYHEQTTPARIQLPHQFQEVNVSFITFNPDTLQLHIAIHLTGMIQLVHYTTGQSLRLMFKTAPACVNAFLQFHPQQSRTIGQVPWNWTVDYIWWSQIYGKTQKVFHYN